MREHPVPCVHATLRDQHRHRTSNDNRVCSDCRRRDLAANRPLGASASEGTPTPSEASSALAGLTGARGVAPAAPRISDLSATHGNARARVGSTASCPMPPSGGQQFQAPPSRGTGLRVGLLPTTLRAFGWSPYRSYLAALAHI